MNNFEEAKNELIAEANEPFNDYVNSALAHSASRTKIINYVIASVLAEKEGKPYKSKGKYLDLLSEIIKNRYNDEAEILKMANYQYEILSRYLTSN